MLKKIISRLVKKYRKITFKLPNNISEDTRRIWELIREKKLTYLSDSRLSSLVNNCKRIESEKVPGDIIEAGCALGGSSLLLCSVKNKNRKLNIYDVFETIPPPGEKDGSDAHQRYEVITSGQAKGIDGNNYYGYEENLMEEVENLFKRNNLEISDNEVALIQGLVQDTLEVTGPVALAHIDLDWYDPVMHCLDKILPHLSPGGTIIFDDYNDWSGCREAVDEYFSKHSKNNYKFDASSGHLCISKVR